jgi:serine/threonine protein phosphatase 1
MPPRGLSLLQRFLSGSGRGSSSLAPAGVALYVVGDIHGRADLLKTLLRKIALDAIRLESGTSRELIFLGDYVDRGPDSKGVIDLILAASLERNFWSMTLLKGNHEQAMLQFLDDPDIWPTWSQFGARETLTSYGVEPPARFSAPEDWARASRALNRALPADHRALLRSLELTAERGDYLCVHAGVRPGVPLEAQTEQDLLWIRDDFLKSEKRLSKVIVHGHTPSEEAYVGPHRIGLDTGAYATGLLTAIKLNGAERTLLQVRAGE